MARGRTSVNRYENLDPNTHTISHRELLTPRQGASDLGFTASSYHEFVPGSRKRKAEAAALNQTPVSSTTGPAYQDDRSTSNGENQSAEALSASALNVVEHQMWTHDKSRSSDENGSIQAMAGPLAFETNVGRRWRPTEDVSRQHSFMPADQGQASDQLQKARTAADHQLHQQSSESTLRMAAPCIAEPVSNTVLESHHPRPDLYGEHPIWKGLLMMPFNPAHDLLSKQDMIDGIGVNTSHEALPDNHGAALGENKGDRPHESLHGRHAGDMTPPRGGLSLSVRDLAGQRHPVYQDTNAAGHLRMAAGDTTREQADWMSGEENGPAVQSQVFLDSNVPFAGSATSSAPDSAATHARTWQSRRSRHACLQPAMSSSGGDQAASAPAATNVSAQVGMSSGSGSVFHHTVSPMQFNTAEKTIKREQTGASTSTGTSKTPPRFRNQDSDCLVCRQTVTHEQLAIAHLRCTACPRVFHGHCLTYIPPSGNQNWRCSLCYRESWHGYGQLAAEREVKQPSLVERYRRRLLLAKTYGRPADPSSIRFWFRLDIGDGTVAADGAVLVQMGMVNRYHLHRHQLPGARPEVEVEVEQMEHWPIALAVSLQREQARSDQLQAQLDGIKVVVAEESGRAVALRAEVETLREVVRGG